MINDINLLPDKILYRKKRILNVVYKVVICFTIVAALSGFVIYRYLEKVHLEKKVSSLTQKINMDALNKLNSAEGNMVIKVTELNSLNDLYKGITNENWKVSELINNVTKHIPATAKTENIHLEEKETKITFLLIFKSRQEIANFLKNIHNEPAFKDVNISEITEEKGKYKFTLILKI